MFDVEDGHFEPQLFEGAVERLAEKALESCSGEVSVAKASTGLGVDERSPLAIALRLSGFRAGTATAKFP